MHIVNAIRLMLVASNTLDKESSTVLAHPNLRTHHRTMMASMSKLALSAQSVHEDTRIVSECNELLGNLKPFIAGCQDLGVPLISVEPQLGQSKQEEEQTVPNHRYSLQLNLAESFETMGTAIQDSAETIMGYVSSWSGDDKTSLVVLLFTHFRNLSNQTGLFLAYLEETDFSRVLEQSEMDDLHRGQRALSDALGLLFVKLQAMTNEHLADFDMALKETREATAALFGPIELICVSVLHLANKNQSRRNSILSPEAPVPLERHNSEQILPSPKPPTVQRSQTQISTKKISEFFPEEEVSTSKINMFFYDENEVHTKPDKPKAPKEEPKEEPVVNERPDFLKHDYDPNEIAYTAEGSVKGGTLSALVERLTLHDYFDMNFINTFLLTYRSFCSTLDLLNLLESRYNLICPEGLTEEESTVWEEKKLKLVRLRVFNVLKNWLELYYNEDDSVLLDRLMHFIETHIRNTLKFSNGQLEQLINKRKEGVPMEQVGLKKMVLSLPAPPEPIYPKNRKQVRLLEIDTLEIARQLTIMDFKLYSAIRPIECLNKAWSKEEDTVAVNIRASIEYCNQITSWVSDVILSQQDIKKRSIVIKYWVQVAEKCRMLNNFNTCMAILSAFDNSSVGRLKRTWEVVGTRTNQTLQHIRKLMGANRNFVEYRALIHSINPPCIPFLGIYLQDLTFIEDGNPNELKKNKEMINFAKRAKTAEVIREIQQYQSSLYQLKTVEEIQEFIKSNLLSTRDEDQLYSESLKIEPREREDEKITRLLQESGFL
ncbi:ras guanine nucleotide exchange factor domain-containing protein [Sporodiniella umbellata]|nr:ras guanine nucleotide exchange factor domain-containing protein [Sporodiniella umbellata]